MDVVTNANDAGTGSLRDTIANANPGDTIIFADSVTTPITLTSGELLITKTLTVAGPVGTTQQVLGDGSHRVFEIAAGAQATLANLTISKGRSLPGPFTPGDSGGGIYNSGALTMTDSMVNDNSAGAGAPGPNCLAPVRLGASGAAPSALGGQYAGSPGGGIYNAGALSISGSTIVSNTAGAGGHAGDCYPSTGGDGGNGGGIVNTGALTITDSTIANNAAGAGVPPVSCNGRGGNGGNGGGIANDGGTVNISNSTIVSNTAGVNGGLPYGGCGGNPGAGGNGGGIANDSGTATLGDTIVAKDVATSGHDCTGILTSGDYNLIQDATGCTLTGGTTHTITGGDPLLGPLQSNGGATFTQAPQAGSPVVDQIPAMACGAGGDQRGLPRPDDNESACDIGAVESGATALARPTMASGAIPWRPRRAVRFAAGLGASVDLADGHVDVGAIDMSVPGRGPSFALGHMWDSALAQNGVTSTAGQGWVDSLTPRMGGILTGTVAYTDATGATYALSYTGALTAMAPYTAYQPPAGLPWQLTASSDGYTLTNFLTGATRTFDPSGRLSVAADSYGNSDAVVDDGTYQIGGALVDSGGRTIAYSYTNGLLTDAASPLWQSSVGTGGQHVTYQGS